MNKKKKIILISLVVIVAVMIIAGIIFACTRTSGKTGENQTEGQGSSKIDTLYNTLSDKNAYSVTMTVNEKNKTFYAKYNGKAYTDIFYNGDETKFIIKDGNSYLLLDSEKTCFTYNNNETNLNKIEDQLKSLQNLEYEEGEEKIENKNYEYEEYNQATSLALLDVASASDVKTRFYFNKGKLVYIKTIADDKQELMKVDISDDVNKDLFEIPSDYQVK